MAVDYHQRGKIKAPTIGLLAKTCLITAGNAWNKMQVQLLNKENERRAQQQQQQNYPTSFVVEETKRRFQQEAKNLVNRPVTERGHPTLAPRLNTSRMDLKRTLQQQSQPQSEDEFYYGEDYETLQ